LRAKDLICGLDLVLFHSWVGSIISIGQDNKIRVKKIA
jgi:hypothetical protein